MCSRIKFKTADGTVIIGRNMDWTEKMGTKLYIMPKGIKREGLTKTNPAKWTSKYGSVAVAVWDGATTDGMNEAGLVANILYLAETNYGDRDDARGGISVSLWCQYFLDNFATVADALEAFKSVQFRAFEITHLGTPADAPVHLSLSDPTGDSAIVEILDGKVVIHHGPQYTVMTNSPIYEEQLVLLKQYAGLGGKKPIPGTAEAEDRFARGAYYLTLLPENPDTYREAVAGVLSVIRNMATPFGANDPVRPNISATQWRTVSDMTNKCYYFEFADMPNLVWIDMNKLDLKAGAPVQMFDMASDIHASGEVSGKFKPTKPFDFYAEGEPLSWKPTPRAQ